MTEDMSYTNGVTTMHLDVLKEIGNIGAAHAATSLSALLNKKVHMNIPSVKVVSINEMMELAGGPENVVVCVFLRIEGDAPGSMFFVLSLEQAERFVHRMTFDTNFQIKKPPYSEMGLSALQELGNILSGSYLSSLSDFTNMNLYPSVPAIAVEMAGAVISFGLMEVSQASDYVIVIDTALLEVEGEQVMSVDGQFFLLPDPPSLEIIFNSLGVSMND